MPRLRPKFTSPCPQCEWFCWSCELQLQDVALPAAAAGRCVSLLLQQEAGRRLMCGHECFGSVLQVGTHATITNTPLPPVLPTTIETPRVRANLS